MSHYTQFKTVNCDIYEYHKMHVPFRTRSPSNGFLPEIDTDPIVGNDNVINIE